jgi:hypothetical protein
MLLVSVLALTTATYAWFTTGHGGKVEQITLTAATADGIELSADAKNWGGIITIDDLNKVDGNQMLGTTTAMDPLSSAGDVANGVMTLYTGTISETDGTLTASAVSDITSVGCVKFDFYVRNVDVENEAVLYLDLASASHSKVAETGNTRATGVDKAVRVAFIDQGTNTITGDTDKDAEAAVALMKGSKSIVWEPVGDDKANVVKYAVSGVAVTNGVATATSNSNFVQINTVTGSESYPELVKVAANSISKVTVYIWLEGQDPDCTNNATGGKFTVDLVFSNKDNS